MLKLLIEKIHYHNIKKKLNVNGINKLKKKYGFLKNVPYSKLSKEDKKYFKKINIIDKDISVLKYADYNRQLKRAFKTFIFFEKNFRGYKNILDLGCGAGYFLHVNKYFKKDIVGIDWFSPNQYYNKNSLKFIKDYNKILKVKPINYKINKNFNPKIKKKFDLITAFSANFDGVYKNRYKFIPWNYHEYQTFFKKIMLFLKPNGKFFIKFNHKWEFKKNFYINEDFKKYLINNKLWYGNGIITNLKTNDKSLKYFK